MKSKLYSFFIAGFLLLFLTGCNEMEGILSKVNQLLDQQLESQNTEETTEAEEETDTEEEAAQTENEEMVEEEQDEYMSDEETDEIDEEESNEAVDEDTQTKPRREINKRSKRYKNINEIRKVIEEDDEEAQEIYLAQMPVILEDVFIATNISYTPDFIPVQFPDYWKLAFDNRDHYKEPEVYFAVFDIQSDKNMEEIISEFGSQHDFFSMVPGTNPDEYTMDFYHPYDRQWYGQFYFYKDSKERKIAIVNLSLEYMWDMFGEDPDTMR